MLPLYSPLHAPMYAYTHNAQEHEVTLVTTTHMSAKAVLEMGHTSYQYHLKLKYSPLYVCSQISNILCKMQMAPLRRQHTKFWTLSHE